MPHYLKKYEHDGCRTLSQWAQFKKQEVSTTEGALEFYLAKAEVDQDLSSFDKLNSLSVENFKCCNLSGGIFKC